MRSVSASTAAGRQRGGRGDRAATTAGPERLPLGRSESGSERPAVSAGTRGPSPGRTSAYTVSGP